MRGRVGLIAVLVVVSVSCGGGGGGGGGTTGPGPTPTPTPKTSARYTAPPWDVSLFFGAGGGGVLAPLSGVDRADGDNLTGNFTNSSSGGFGGSLRGVLTGNLDSGTFDGTLITITAAGCKAERRYTGPLSATTLNWTPGDHVNDCGGGSPLSAPVQAPAVTTTPCTLTATLGTETVPQGGATRTATVSTAGGCAWHAGSTVPWITLSRSQGTGSGDVTVTIAASTGARSGTIEIASRTFTINQDGPASGCSYALSAPSATVPASGGNGSVTVSTASTCAWSASSGVSWISVSGGGPGNGTVSFTASANADATARTGTLTIAGQPFIVNQPAGGTACSYALKPAATTFAATGGNSTIAVTAGAGCNWTSSSAVSWISVTPGTGSGSGTVSFTVAANTDPGARSGVITVGGETVTINQNGASCNYTVTASNTSFGDSGNTGTVAVATTTGCTWTASSTVPWITLSTGNGTGNGTVNFTVAANTGAARSGTLNVAGQAIQINQAAAPVVCTASLSTTTVAVAGAGGSPTIAVTIPAGCAWTTSSQASFVTVAPANSTGSGTATLTVAANAGAARSGAVTIAGIQVAVEQTAAGPCTYTTDVTSLFLGGTAGTRTVTLTTGSNCSWSTNNGQAPWITLSPQNGTGSATITLTYTTNTDGGLREGNFAVADRTISVIQSSGLSCTLLVNPFPGPTVPAGGASNLGVSILVADMASKCPGLEYWEWHSNDSWITYAGSGPAPNSRQTSMTDQTIRYNVAPNSSAARNGQIAMEFRWHNTTRNYGYQISQQAGTDALVFELIYVETIVEGSPPSIDWRRSAVDPGPISSNSARR